MKIKKFQEKIWKFYKEKGRKLPWRETTDPYKILVSEIMLQQTQVVRVLPKYKEFVKTFPNFSTLSRASTVEILKAWQGLGYNRRALYLREIAVRVMREFGGKLPLDPDILAKFPGIGKNTACSVVVFSSNKSLVFIETNIRRVFIHFFFNDRIWVHDSELFPLIDQTLDKKNPREWYFALMDYGSMFSKTVQNPNRKSKHYAKQSKFEGSLRQVRGEILRRLLKEKEVTSSKLRKGLSRDLFSQAIGQLIKENFVTVRDRLHYTIRDCAS